MKQVVLASGNRGKLREIQSLLGDVMCLLPQSDFLTDEVEETGLSFLENAILKARHAAHHSGLPALADDSGLAVDALDGAPGIYSARYADPQASDRQNIDKLLHEMAGLPEHRRTARFHCVVVYMKHELDPTPLVCQGAWEGLILNEPRGSNGFGYDPVFYIATHNCSAAELPAEVKMSLSHRGLALRKLRALLQMENASVQF